MSFYNYIAQVIDPVPYNPIPYEYTLQDYGIYGSYVNWLKYGPFPPQGEWADSTQFQIDSPYGIDPVPSEIDYEWENGYSTGAGYSYAEGFDDHAYNEYDDL